MPIQQIPTIRYYKRYPSLNMRLNLLPLQKYPNHNNPSPKSSNIPLQGEINQSNRRKDHQQGRNPQRRSSPN